MFVGLWSQHYQHGTYNNARTISPPYITCLFKACFFIFFNPNNLEYPLGSLTQLLNIILSSTLKKSNIHIFWRWGAENPQILRCGRGDMWAEQKAEALLGECTLARVKYKQDTQKYNYNHVKTTISRNIRIYDYINTDSLIKSTRNTNRACQRQHRTIGNGYIRKEHFWGTSVTN